MAHAVPASCTASNTASTIVLMQRTAWMTASFVQVLASVRMPFSSISLEWSATSKARTFLIHWMLNPPQCGAVPRWSGWTAFGRSYFELHDRPILYAQPDTVSTMVGSARATVAVYSAGGTLTASDALASSAPVLDAIGNYSRGNPSHRSICHPDICRPARSVSHGIWRIGTSDEYGALFARVDPELMGKEIRNIVAHEFLHIVPLAIHAQQINDFDFYSQHVQAPLALRRGH